MLTTIELIGLLALVVVVVGAGFLIQRLDTAIAGGGEEAAADASAGQLEGTETRAAEGAAPRPAATPRKYKRSKR